MMPGADDRRRLDHLLVAQGLAESRSRAQALIAAGLVLADGAVQDKASRMLPAATPLALSRPDHPWASRGGLKLIQALDYFGIDPVAQVALDLGASTGGFTDVLLARGAARVYAIDVGHGQLLPRLAADPRVIAHERVNARAIGRDLIAEPVDIITCDVSFIGLELALPAALALAAPGAALVALVKPQFEVGAGRVGKGGIVRDAGLRAAVCRRLTDWLAAQPGWSVLGMIDSPIIGGDGNQEYLLAGRLT